MLRPIISLLQTIYVNNLITSVIEGHVSKDTKKFALTYYVLAFPMTEHNSNGDVQKFLKVVDFTEFTVDPQKETR